MEYKFVPLLTTYLFRAEKFCESRGGRPGLPVRNSPDGLCRRKATLNLNLAIPCEGKNTPGCLVVGQDKAVMFQALKKRVRLAKKNKKKKKKEQ